MNSAVIFENVSFTYNGASAPALIDVNLRIGRGEFILVSGRSGSGKTSLCRAINGLIPHFHGGAISGSITVAGLSPLEVPPGLMATRVGMVFQNPENQLVTSDVSREICFGMENLAFSRKLMAERLEDSLKLLDIGHLRSRPFYQLSGGEKQRIAIASVLAMRPDILILDEPTSELDPDGSAKTLFYLRCLNRDFGLTVVVVEHRLDRVIQYADRLIIMEKGRLIMDNHPKLAMKEHGKSLQSLGIGAPPVVQLYHKLKEKGAKLDEMPLSLEDAPLAFSEVFNRQLSAPPEGKKTITGLPAVEMQKVSFSYPNGLKAVDEVSVAINRGEVTAVVGCNASGKTTLIKLANGLLSPDEGVVKILGQTASGKTVAELAESVGVVFQNPGDHLFADTVEQEIAFGLTLRGAPPQEVQKRVDAALSQFNLEFCRGRSPQDLSSGEKQRLALASITVYAPPVLALDEPERGSEDGGRRYLAQRLNDYSLAGNAVILVTHDMELVADVAQRVIVMDAGRIVLDGSKREVLSTDGLFSPQINRLVKHFKQCGVSSKFLIADEVAQAYYE